MINLVNWIHRELPKEYYLKAFVEKIDFVGNSFIDLTKIEKL